MNKRFPKRAKFYVLTSAPQWPLWAWHLSSSTDSYNQILAAGSGLECVPECNSPYILHRKQDQWMIVEGARSEKEALDRFFKNWEPSFDFSDHHWKCRKINDEIAIFLGSVSYLEAQTIVEKTPDTTFGRLDLNKSENRPIIELINEIRLADPLFKDLLPERLTIPEGIRIFEGIKGKKLHEPNVRRSLEAHTRKTGETTIVKRKCQIIKKIKG